MYVERLRSDEARMKVCICAQQKLPSLLEKTNMHIVTHVLDDLKKESSDFMARFKTIRKKEAERRHFVERKKEVMANLKVHVRQGRQTVENRIVREAVPKVSLIHYRDRVWSKPRSYPDWIDAAATLVAGDAHAVKAGYRPMAEPTAGEIDAACKRAVKLQHKTENLQGQIDELENLQKPDRKNLDIILRKLKSLIIAESGHNSKIWRVLLRAAGYTIRYDTQLKEEDTLPETLTGNTQVGQQ